MAVPPSAYNEELYNDAQFCYRLSEYAGNEKLLFFLDALFVKNTIGLPFIGLVKVGSANYSMHNPSRINSFRAEIGSDIYLLLSDGGLNTLPLLPAINNNTLQWANNVRFNITYKSAYFLETTFIGVRYRLNGGAWTELSFFGTLDENLSITSDRTFDTGGIKDDLLEVQGLAKNSEGDKYSASYNIILKERIYQYDVFKRVSSCDDTGQETVSIWLTEDEYDLLDTVPEFFAADTGLYFYSDIEHVTRVSTGWFIGIQNNKSFFADVNGQITRYIECVPEKGSIYLALEQDGEGNLSPIYATVDPTWPSSDIVITGRVDVHPTLATPDGMNFSVTIPAGNVEGFDYAFSLPYDTGKVYYWQNVTASPSGFNINLSTI